MTTDNVEQNLTEVQQPVEPTEEQQLENQIAGLIDLAQDCAKEGDTSRMLEIAEEIAQSKSAIKKLAKERQEVLYKANEVEILEAIEAIRMAFASTLENVSPLIEKLSELGHKVEIVKFVKEFGNETESLDFQCGPHKAKSTSTNSNGDGTKSRKVVVLSDGTEMGTREFVEEYATDAERETKTFKDWTPSMAPKVAKRVGAEIKQKS